MSELRIYPADDPSGGRDVAGREAIARELDAIGVLFEGWEAGRELPPGAGQEAVLEAYKDDVRRLNAEYGFQSVDVISITPEAPNLEAIRNKFLDEHYHGDFEVRFFVEGKGLFFIHQGDRVYEVLCEKGDLISIPANTTHWFDMGPAPRLTAIRLFTTPNGWEATFTGSDIARRFPRLEA